MALNKKVASLANPRLFVDQMLSHDPLAWRNALMHEREALVGRVLDDYSFDMMLYNIRPRPEKVTQAWLETLAPYLTPSQLNQIINVKLSMNSPTRKEKAMTLTEDQIEDVNYSIGGSISLRDLIALEAMKIRYTAAISASNGNGINGDLVASQAYAMADAMLSARSV